jgi:hypothetical protein
LIGETYPPEFARFLARERDRFANPVGYTLSHALETIYDEICGDQDPEKLSTSLDTIIKVRAVQDFTPSQAVIFAFLLKNAVREALVEEMQDGQLAGELHEFESKVDSMALLAFDLYTKRREKIYEIRVREAKERSEMLLERMNLIYGIPGLEQGAKDLDIR